MDEPIFLTSSEVAGLATPADYVDAVREGYREVGNGAPAYPRQQFFRSDPDGSLTAYGTLLPEIGATGGYMYTAGFGAGDAWFLTPVFDAESGRPLALVDGASMNPFKTGAAGAVAVDELARADADTVAVIGSGSQARGQLYTTNVVRDLTEVAVYSPTKDNREAFAEELDGTLEATVSAVESSAAALAGADIVITATKAKTPVFDGRDLEPGTHVTAMGQYTPETRELDTVTMERATYVPDLRERVFQDAGAFLLARAEGAIDEDDIHAELGDVVAGTAPGRTDEDEITVFDSGGTGIETVAAAYMLYERAREEGLGTPLAVEPASEALTGRPQRRDGD